MKILICGKAFPDCKEELTPLLPDDDVQNCPTDKVVEIGVASDVIIPTMHKLETELIENTRARLIHQWGVGLEGVDIPLATARGILVCNVPADKTVNADSTAEHAVLLMLAAARRIRECFSAFQLDKWGWPSGDTLIGGTALIVGLGNVGTALAMRLKAFGMKIMAIKRTPSPELQEQLGISRLEMLDKLHELSRQADFVISTIVLNEITRGIFDKSVFSVMPHGSYFINVSRGPVVNESDLYDALKTGKLAGAGLDVFAVEPTTEDNPLLSLPNVIATPHIGGATRRNYRDIAQIVAANINRHNRGEIPNYCVNQVDLVTMGVL